MKTFTKIWLGIALVALGFGIILVIIVVSSGGTIVDMPTVSYQESYTGVTDIDIDIEFGEVKIVRGNEFSIDAKNMPENGLESYVENGTWTVRALAEETYHVFGGRISLDPFWHWWGYNTPRIEITIPDNFTAESFLLKVEAGDVNVEQVLAAKADFKVSAGRLVIEEARITDQSEYAVDAGSMELRELEAKDITVACGVGSVFIDGTITGNNVISCDVGNVELNLSGDEKDYSYDIDSDLGNISIDNDRYHSISNKIIENNNAEAFFALQCDIGNISVDFR